MGRNRRELYREFTNWSPWVHVVLWGAVGSSAVVAPWPWAGVLLLLGALIQFVFGGLLVTVEPDGVRIGLGQIRLIRSFVPFADIVRLESVTYRPLRDFGGWGYRGNRDERVWSARGNEAVLLHTADGRRIYVGSDEPAHLESRIRNAMSVGGHASRR